MELKKKSKVTGEVGLDLLDMINSMPYEVSILDKNHKILFVNKTKAEKHFNPDDKNRAVLKGKHCFDIFPSPAKRGHICSECPVIKVLELKAPFQREAYEDFKGHHFSIDGDGNSYPVNEYAAPLKFDEHGEVSLMLHVIEDITRVHYLKAFSQQSQNIADENQLIDALFRNIKLMGYERARLFFLENKSLIGIRCLGEHKCLSKDNFENLQIQVPEGKLKEGIEMFQTPKKFIDEKKSDYFYAHDDLFEGNSLKEWITCPLIISNQVKGILELDNGSKKALDNKDLEILADLSRFFSQTLSNIRRNKEIEKTNTLLDVIIESVPEGISVLNEKGIRVLVNKAALEILKMTKKDLIRTNIRNKSIYWDKMEYKRIENMLEKGPVRGYHTTFKDRQGNRIDVSHNVSYLYDNSGKISGTVGVFRDIRKEKALQAVATELISKDDINEILQSIVKKASEVMEIHRCSIRLEEDGILKVRAETGFKESIKDYPDKYPIKPGMGICGRVYIQGKPIQVEDLADDGRFLYHDLIKAEGLQSMLCLPLKYTYKPIGTLNCYTNQKRIFSEEEINLLMTFANQASIAIQNARNKAGLKEKMIELDIEAKLQNIVLESSLNANIYEMLKKFLEKTIKLLEAESGHIRLLEDEKNLKCYSSTGEYSEFLPKVRKIGDLFSGKIAEEKKPIIVNNTDKNGDCLEFRDEYPAYREILKKLKSFVGFPIIHAGLVLGTLNLEALNYDHFDTRRVNMLEKLINRMAPVIKLYMEQREKEAELVQSRQAAEVSVKKLNTLFKVSEEVTASFDLDTICRSVAEGILSLDSKYACCLVRVRNERGQLVVRGSAGFRKDEKFFPINIGDKDSISGQVAETGMPFQIPDLLHNNVKHKFPSLIRDYNLTSMLCMPLKPKEENLGIFSIYTKETHEFQKSEIKIFETFTGQLNQAIWNAETYGKSISFMKIAQYIQKTENIKTALKYILSGITANEGLGFNRAIIFHYNSSDSLYKGFAAVGARSKKAAQAIWEEIKTIGLTFDHILQQVTENTLNPEDLDHGVEDFYFKKDQDFPPILDLIRYGRPIVCREDYSNDPDFSIQLREVIDKKEFVFSPIFLDDVMFGIVYADRTFDRKEIEYRTLDDLKMFCDLIASTIRQFRIAETRENIIREISHTIATPISSICNTSEFLLETSGLSKVLKAKLSDILRKARQSDLMVKKISALTRIRSGKLEIEPTETSLKEIIDNARYLFSDQDIARIKVEEFEDRTIQTDFTSISLALSMLIDNALKYSTIKKVVIIKVTYGIDYLKISILDKGKGIKEEMQGKIFNEFFRGEEKVDDVAGLGIGLSIACSYVEENGGKIHFKSRYGQGSTFWIELPINQREKNKEKVKNES
jgi:PAS domain S-box-containing protein